ncbi:epididymis-specific alpha-mannosidase-like isoform X2 [Oscarella lobularis]
MHDEAVTTFPAIVNQMTYGLDFLHEQLDYRPRIGWHIDPFGASIFTPTLYALLGYDAMVINRIPDQTKQLFKRSQHLEFNWQSHALLAENETTIFTHVLDSHYSTPLILGLSVEEKASSLAKTCHERSAWFRTDHLLVPFGSDFQFTDAESKFRGMDSILSHINANQDHFNMTIRYTTLSEYFDAVQSTNASFPTYSGRDFFPYIACSPCGSSQCGGLLSPIPCGSDDCFWSGFFTSKPQQKLLSRQQDASLRALETAFASSTILPQEANGVADVLETLDLGRSTSALLQHHDALPGTSFPSCYDDYNDRLHSALSQAKQREGLLLVLQLCGAESGFVSNFSTNTSAFESNSSSFVVVVHNSLGWTRSEVIEIDDIPEGICLKSVDPRYTSQQVGSVLYVRVTVGPLSAVALLLEKIACNPNSSKKSDAAIFLSNSLIRLDIDSDGRLMNFIDFVHNKSLPLTHTILRYLEHRSFDPIGFSQSSVYTFMTEEEPVPFSPDPGSATITAEGPLVWEVKESFGQYIEHSYRLVANSSDIQMHTSIGPLPDEPWASYVSTIQSGVNSGPLSFTVDNEFQEMAREFNSSVPVQGNTYPLTGRVTLRDSGSVVTWIVKRPVAVFAVNGSISIMLHRRLESLFDRRGNDASVMSDISLLKIRDASEADCLYCDSMKAQYPLSTVFIPLTDVREWSRSCKEAWNGMSVESSLPKSLHLVSLQVKAVSTSERIVGLRLHHNNVTSTVVSFDLQRLFPALQIRYANETSVDFHRIIRKVKCTLSGSPRSCNVHFRPMALQSYLCTLSTA